MVAFLRHKNGKFSIPKYLSKASFLPPPPKKKIFKERIPDMMQRLLYQHQLQGSQGEPVPPYASVIAFKCTILCETTNLVASLFFKKK